MTQLHSVFTYIKYAITLIIVFSSLQCTTVQNAPDNNNEKWVGKMSGMADGELSFFLSQQGSDGKIFVNSKFIMDLERTAGGYGGGQVKGRITGSIVNDVFEASISGYVYIEGGQRKISGKMHGTVSDQRISGTWIVRHRAGSHSGQWSVTKVVTSHK